MNELIINFGDPESIRAAIPQVAKAKQRAEERIEEAERELHAAAEKRRRAQADLDRTNQLDAFLRGTMRGPEDGIEVRPDGLDLPELPEDASSKEVVLRVITLINGPATTASVATHMPEFSSKTVSWALWKLAEDGAIQKLKHGLYAPLGYVEGQPTTNYFEAAKLGLPVPSSQQISAAVEDTITRALSRSETGGP
jgi:hypothetical protein